MSQINYPNDVTGSIQIVHGSDGRLNVSSRSDSRHYYNSRDNEQSYIVPFLDAASSTGEIVVYLQNTSTTLTLVISVIGVSTSVLGTFKLHKMNATTATGTVITPVNLNFGSSNAAAANARGGAGGVGGTASDTLIDVLQVGAAGHGEFHTEDTLRLGQNQSVGLEFDRAAGDSIVEGSIFCFFE